jgi:hypothetical protein
MTSPSDDLVPMEGVDEGSAASATEGPGQRHADTSNPVQNPISKLLGDPPKGTPLDEADPAAPDDTESDASRAARDQAGPGQQLQAGEG